MQLPLLIAGATLCAAAGVGMYMDHLSEQRAQVAALRAEAEYAEGQVLPKTPSGTVRSLHSLIGYAGDRGGADPACSLMTRSAQQAFAAAHGQPDCSAAARMLGSQVTNRNRYAMFQFAEQAEIVQGEQGSMDGCAITWRGAIDPSDLPDPGPRLGRFTLHRVVGLGFKITGVEPCAPTGPATRSSPRPLPPVSPPPGSANSAPAPVPTSSPPAGLLPGYAPGLPGILAGRIAKNDPGACELFTDTGRAQFVAARKTIDCAAAVASMHRQVSDPEVYRDPRGATEAPGRPVVDGCHLTWSIWSGQTHPGPQIGRLELERPPDHVGYLIAGYRPC